MVDRDREEDYVYCEPAICSDSKEVSKERRIKICISARKCLWDDECTFKHGLNAGE